MRDETGGDPISGVKWTRKSSRAVSRELIRQGHPACARTVSRLLKDMDFSLKANVKRLSGPRHPNREAQFQRIAKQVAKCRREGLPVLSVDAKKKELIGNFHNAGRIWRREEIAVADHDFRSDGVIKVVPYGLYDIVRNRGMVVVGTSHETSSFGVDALTEWYRREGYRAYPDAEELLILCDNGGCNGSQRRLWKVELQRFCDQFDIAVRVSHYPPRASKWNPIEHRMFSFISKNWAGQPLKDIDTMLNYIRTTRTSRGLRVKALLLPGEYPLGVKVSDEELASVTIRRARQIPRWNYVIQPRQN